MRTLLSVLFCACTALANSAWAALAEIAEVQAPAWLDRNGLTVPLSPAVELLAGDTVRTGQGARLLLKLVDGSVVRLGENAHFVLETIERKRGVTTAAFDVLKGAFRFTTAGLAKLQPRDVRIRVARNATIGIRGTDVWGRGRNEKDIVCLIEGKIDITGNDGKTLRLDQPLQFFQSTRSAPPEAIGFVDPKQLLVWAAETDLEAGKGAKAGAPWKVTVGGLVSREAQLDVLRNLRAAGYAAEPGAGAVVIGQLAGEAEANDLASRIKSEFALVGVTVSK